jgi:hypothetical protein
MLISSVCFFVKLAPELLKIQLNMLKVELILFNDVPQLLNV